ncbi:TDP-4-oxo-6-deoxy-alpha-D-glucose-3, 4-oxoisomerase [Pseudomonas sp. OF001]|uniref:sugar 3,4-ketoisomerase n=1 Tax=unclassified Pseudomonas TaxID=196821 RepID=UPI0015B0A5A4|nr:MULTISPECIES: FdtA/QdtA family cupin domain-containing protein [unclassified Pseudomonas]CAD5375441.1 TDP-4-oxo-6-deoxy-alpha-D-glucose-3, 4-oxoisomerase [Pseudomonas sp. OF001]
MSLTELIELKVMGDERGKLVALEGGRNIPFDIKRVYYLTDTVTGISRGFHAHRQLEQIAICVSGRCRMLMDDGVSREEVWLDAPDKAIRISRMIWHEMHDFSSDCVLLVLASDHYDESDYIRSYPAFLELTRNA